MATFGDRTVYARYKEEIEQLDVLKLYLHWWIDKLKLQPKGYAKYWFYDFETFKQKLRNNGYSLILEGGNKRLSVHDTTNKTTGTFMYAYDYIEIDGIVVWKSNYRLI